MLGVALLEQCVKNNVQVLAIAHKNSSKVSWLPQSPLISIAECDICDIKNIDVQPDSYDVLYHFAWEGNASSTTRDDPLTHARNIQYTLDAVEFAHKMDCKKFIGAGSQAEYGLNSDRLFPETKVYPSTSYGVAKFAAGKLSRKLCELYGISFIWTRIFSVYGEHDRDVAVIKYAIRQFRAWQPAQFSAATQMWNYLYEKDAGKIFYLLGEKDVPEGVYNVASEDTRPLKDFIMELKEVYGKEAICQFAPPSDQPTVSLDPDISSLTKAIGWHPDTTFKQGILNMINKNNRGGA